MSLRHERQAIKKIAEQTGADPDLLWDVYLSGRGYALKEAAARARARIKTKFWKNLEELAQELEILARKKPE